MIRITVRMPEPDCFLRYRIYTTLFTVQRTAATKQLKKEKQQLTVQSGGHICPTFPKL